MSGSGNGGSPHVNTGTGGASGSGGSASTGGSTGARATGGSTGSGSTGGTSSAYWPSAYNATQGAKGMNPGQNCLSSCHNHGFAFAGTVYDSAGKGVASVEVGVKLATGSFYSVFSGASTGNFFYTGPALNLAGADIRVRNGNGEKQMPVSSSSTGACNSCHDGTTNPRITAP